MEDLDEEEKARMLVYLQGSDAANPLVAMILEANRRSAVRPHKERPWMRKAKDYLWEKYHQVAGSPVFEKAVLLFFLTELIITIVITVTSIFFPGFAAGQILRRSFLGEMNREFHNLSFSNWVELASFWGSAFFVLRGILLFRKDRLEAFRMFEHAIIISILLTQIFAFYRKQLGGILELVWNLFLWFSLRSMIGIEKTKKCQN